MSEEKKNRRRSEPPLVLDDSKITPAKNEVFHTIPTSATHHYEQRDLDETGPFALQGDDLYGSGKDAEKDVVYLPTSTVDRSACLMPISRSWDCPLESNGDGQFSAGGGDTGFSFLQPSPPAIMDDSFPCKLQSSSLDESTCLGGGMQYGGGKLDEMYLSFGSCNIIEPIFANEMCVLEQDQPMFIRPEWLCREQKF